MLHSDSAKSGFLFPGLRIALIAKGFRPGGILANDRTFYGVWNRSECAFQYSSQMTSVWCLKKDQYKPCPSIHAPQKKDSIIVLLRWPSEGLRRDLQQGFWRVHLAQDSKQIAGWRPCFLPTKDPRIGCNTAIRPEAWRRNNWEKVSSKVSPIVLQPFRALRFRAQDEAVLGVHSNLML